MKTRVYATPAVKGLTERDLQCNKIKHWGIESVYFQKNKLNPCAWCYFASRNEQLIKKFNAILNLIRHLI